MSSLADNNIDSLPYIDPAYDDPAVKAMVCGTWHALPCVGDTWQVNGLIDEEKGRYRPSLRQYLANFPLPTSHPEVRAVYNVASRIIGSGRLQGVSLDFW